MGKWGLTPISLQFHSESVRVQLIKTALGW